MDSSEAREHLEMVDRILSQAEGASSGLNPAPLLITWGLAGAILDIVDPLVFAGGLSPQLLWISGLALLAGVAVSIDHRRRLGKSARVSVFERQIGLVFYAAWIPAAVVDVAGGHLFPGWGPAAIWSVAIAVPLLFMGFQGHRYSLAGGLILLASIVAANFAPPAAVGYVLGAGMLLGLAGTGILIGLAWRADDRG